MTAVVVRGDAGRLPLPDESVDLIVTSPPYFALRSYTDGGEHYAGQLGSEATPAEYIAALIACTREWVRVLKPSGSIFVNLGDKYSQRANGGPSVAMSGRADRAKVRPPAKSLLLLPERYRIAAVDDLGLIARAVIVWSKPNGLPESVTDRVRRSHEDWVHLTKQPRYFAAVDEIREPASGYERAPARRPTPGGQRPRAMADTCNPLGKLPGSVWEVATEPLRKVPGVDVDHFAAFPSEWPRRLILGWSPAGICTACGEGRRPVVVRKFDLQPDVSPSRNTDHGRLDESNGWGSAPRGSTSRSITGYACACTPYIDHPPTDEEKGWREYLTAGWDAPQTRPAVVLDPFGGTGTTAHVADALGRTGITVDLSRDYGRLAAAPELAAARRRKVLGLDKPPPPVAGPEQGDLFAAVDEP